MKTMLISKNKILDRIDVGFYDRDYFRLVSKLRSIAQKNSQYEISEIRDILSKDDKDITGGATPLGATYLEEGIMFIRVQNVRKNKLKLKDVKFIPKFIHEDGLKRSQLKPNDVLLTITGVTYGLSAVVPETIKEANMNQHSVRIRVDTQRIMPKFLSLFLNSQLGKKQTDRYITGATRPALDYESVRSIKILHPKSLTEQQNIIRKSEKYIRVADKKYSDFKKLLKNCMSLVENTLNVKIKPHKVHMFLLNSQKAKLNRIDCYFHSPVYRRIRMDLRKSEKNNKCNVIKGKELNIIKDKINVSENASKFYKYVDIGNTEKKIGSIIGYEEDVLINLPSRARQIMRENDVLLPRPIGSTEGVIIVPKEFSGHLCSTGFIQIRPNDYNEAVLLWLVLKSKAVQEQLFYLQSGSLQPEITPVNFRKKVLIPIPKNNDKKKLIDKAKESIKELITLREEHRKNLELSEKVFVNSLIG